MNVISFGFTSNNKPRFRCLQCFRVFIDRRISMKKLNEQSWFKLWVAESFSIRQLCKISSHSASTLQRIKNYWLAKNPTETIHLCDYSYLLLDGTYFHKDGCCVCFKCAITKIVVTHIFIKKEGYYCLIDWFQKLKTDGLNPIVIILDGEKSVLRAIREVWPWVITQRCLYHIQREGMRWLRSKPKTLAGKELRALLKSVCFIDTFKDQIYFMQHYQAWLRKHKEFVKQLPKDVVAYKDLKKTMTLINNALPDMFHYLEYLEIPRTTNAIEGLYSNLKSDYNRHRGLSRQHRIQYLKWYFYFKNQAINNNF